MAVLNRLNEVGAHLYLARSEWGACLSARRGRALRPGTGAAVHDPGARSLPSQTGPGRFERVGDEHQYAELIRQSTSARNRTPDPAPVNWVRTQNRQHDLSFRDSSPLSLQSASAHRGGDCCCCFWRRQFWLTEPSDAHRKRLPVRALRPRNVGRPSPLAGYFTTCGNIHDGVLAYRLAGLPLTLNLAARAFRRQLPQARRQSRPDRWTHHFHLGAAASADAHSAAAAPAVYRRGRGARRGACGG
jgi:hypothetical protein